MYGSPELLSRLAHEHTVELIEEASRHRLATALRRGRRQLWPDSQEPRSRDHAAGHVTRGR